MRRFTTYLPKIRGFWYVEFSEEDHTAKYRRVHYCSTKCEKATGLLMFLQLQLISPELVRMPVSRSAQSVGGTILCLSSLLRAVSYILQTVHLGSFVRSRFSEATGFGMARSLEQLSGFNFTRLR